MENKQKIVVVGGVAAGASAAAKARRADDGAEIVVFEKGAYVSFANCGLPYFIGGEISERDELLLVTPERFRERFHIDVRVRSEVTAINRARKTVTVHPADDALYEESYDKLVLALGAAPVRPRIDGLELKGVRTVLTVGDADAIVAALSCGVKNAVVIGGGFIGLETAEALLRRGVATALIELQSQLMPNFDPEFSLPPERRLIASGCVLRLGTAAAAIRGNDRAEYVELSDGSALPAELVILATGMRPRVSLAVAAGLKTGETGSLYVDERMRTSDPAIFAAGDMTESIHRISGKRTNVPLAGPANKQGRIAGANVVAVTNAADSGMKYAGVLGTSVIRLYDLTAARTGLSETEAKRAGIDCCSVYAPAASHASYYPNAGWIILKLTSERSTGKLLGAQAIGSEGVEKRIDVLATALYAGLSVYDLENLDLCYSPPYSSAKDPVNTAGMIASDALRGDVKIVQPSDLKEFLADTGAILVDIRTPQEWRNGIIQGALTIELDALRAEPSLLDRAETYVLYCGVGYRAYIACRFLSQLGYNVYNLTGGWNAYGMDV